MTDLTPDEILSAIDRALERVSNRFAGKSTKSMEALRNDPVYGSRSRGRGSAKQEKVRRHRNLVDGGWMAANLFDPRKLAVKTSNCRHL